MADETPTDNSTDITGTPSTAPVPNTETAKTDDKVPSRDELKGLIREVIAEIAPKEETPAPDSTPVPPVPPVTDTPVTDTKPTGVPWTHRGRR